jgi:hypothetical protein
MKNLVKIILLFVFLSSILFPQVDTSFISSEKKSTDSVFIMQKSPWGAVVRSAILPGFGQIYNESYWKVPIIWGFAGWFIYNWTDLNKLYKDNQALYQGNNQSIYKIRRDFYRDQRDKFAIYLGLLYFINLVDAYVDAHLFDFYIESNSLNDFQINFQIHLR